MPVNIQWLILLKILKAYAQNYLDKVDGLYISIGVCWNFTLYLASGILGPAACIVEVVGSSEVFLYICQKVKVKVTLNLGLF